MGYWGIGPFDSDQIRDEIGGWVNAKKLRESCIRLYDEHYTQTYGIAVPGYCVTSLILCSYGVTLNCFKVNNIKEIKTVMDGSYKVDGYKLIIDKDFDAYGDYHVGGKKVFIGEMGFSMLTCTLIKDREDILKLFLNKLAKEVKEPLEEWNDPEELRKNMFEVLKAGTAVLNKINSKQSKTFEVVDIGRYNNKIVSYMLRDCTGKSSIVDANLLKENMIHNGVTLTNYTLTSDRRLVPKKK